MRIFSFIPARYQSTRFPGKPLAPISGKPMIQHVYERAASCNQVREVYVATDDARIYECVSGFGGRAVMTGRDHLSGTDRICEAAQKIGVGWSDIVVNIQGDQPLFDTSVVSSLTAPLIEDDSVAMATLKCRIGKEEEVFNPNLVKVVTDKDDFALYFSRSPIPFFRERELRRIYYKHLGFYAFRMEFLLEFTRLPEGVLESAERLEQLRALEYGYRIKVMETPYSSIDVDVPEDVGRAEELIEKG